MKKRIGTLKGKAIVEVSSLKNLKPHEVAYIDSPITSKEQAAGVFEEIVAPGCTVKFIVIPNFKVDVQEGTPPSADSPQ